MHSQRPSGEWTGDPNDLLTRITWNGTVTLEDGRRDTLRITPTQLPGYFWMTSELQQKEHAENRKKPLEERVHLTRRQLLVHPGDSFQVMAGYPLARDARFATTCQVLKSIKDSSRRQIAQCQLGFPSLTAAQMGVLQAGALPDRDGRFAHGPPGSVGVRRPGYSDKYLQGQRENPGALSTTLNHYWSVKDTARTRGGTVEVDEDAAADRIMDQRSIWNPQEQRRLQMKAIVQSGGIDPARLKEMGYTGADRRRLARYYPV